MSRLKGRSTSEAFISVPSSSNSLIKSLRNCAMLAFTKRDRARPMATSQPENVVFLYDFSMSSREGFAP